jgi:NhaP-type Na+/H+ and K+/H+ antiporter
MDTVHAISDADMEIVELAVGEASPLGGKSLRESELPRESLVLYVIRGSATMMPEGSLMLQAGDQLGILTRKRFIGKLEDRFAVRP